MALLLPGRNEVAADPSNAIATRDTPHSPWRSLSRPNSRQPATASATSGWERAGLPTGFTSELTWF